MTQPWTRPASFSIAVEHSLDVLVPMLVGDLEKHLAGQRVGEHRRLLERRLAPPEDHDLGSGGRETQRDRSAEMPSAATHADSEIGQRVAREK